VDLEPLLLLMSVSVRNLPTSIAALHYMKIGSFKKTPRAFSNLEALVVIVITIALSLVLVPALAYRIGWMEPPRGDIDINLRPVAHPGTSFIPKNYRLDDDHEKNVKNQK
jgi:hypothetical protein